MLQEGGEDADAVRGRRVVAQGEVALVEGVQRGRGCGARRRGRVERLVDAVDGADLQWGQHVSVSCARYEGCWCADDVAELDGAGGGGAGARGEEPAGGGCHCFVAGMRGAGVVEEGCGLLRRVVCS